METIYCRLSTRKVHIGGMASGGAYEEEGERYVLVPQSGRGEGQDKGGRVLDFETCRRRLERTEEECPPQPRPERERGHRWGLILDLCATAGVLAVTLAAAVRFLTF